MNEIGPMASPGFWLHHAALRWRATLDDRLHPLGLTPTQFIVLASVSWLERGGEAPTQNDVAQQAGADRMMTSRVLRGLENALLLERVADEADARARRVRLTGDGGRLVDRATALAREVDEEIFGVAAGEMRAALRVVAAGRVTAAQPATGSS